MEELIRSLSNLLYESGVEPEEADSSAKRWVMENIKPVLYLVITPSGWDNKDRWQLFKSKDKAVAYAKERGYHRAIIQEVSDETGVASSFRQGVVDVTIIPLEVNR